EPAALGAEQPDERAGEGEIAGTAAVVRAPERVDATDDVGRKADARAEAEAAAVDAADGDPARPSCLQRRRDPLSGRDRVARHAERARENTRATAGQEADRDVPLEPVQRLVEAAVAGEDDDRVDAVAAGGGDEVRRVARVLREHDV